MNDLQEMLMSVNPEEVMELSKKLEEEGKTYEELVEMLPELLKRIESDNLEDGKLAMRDNMVVMETMQRVYREETEELTARTMAKIHEAGFGENE